MTPIQFEQAFDLFINATVPFDYNKIQEVTNPSNIKPGSLVRCIVTDHIKDKKKQPYDSYPLMLVLDFNSEYILYVNMNSFNRDQMKIVCSAIIAHTTSFCNQRPDIQPIDILKIIETFQFSRRRMIRTALVKNIKSIKYIDNDLFCIEALSKNDLLPDYFINTTRDKYRKELTK